jgi:hypothetical protein
MRLRKLGIPVPWRIAEIQDEWFGGNVLNWDTLDIEESFRAAQLAAGSRWVLGSEIGLTPFGGLEGIGRRGGFSEFLRVYWFGRRAVSLRGAVGARGLLRRVLAGEPAAGEEATSAHLLRARHRDTQLEFDPPTKVGAKTKHPDFRIRKAGAPWTFVEVTMLGRSRESSRVGEAIQNVAEAISRIEGSFMLEIILNREPTVGDASLLASLAAEVCKLPDGEARQIGDLGVIFAKGGDARVVIPSVQVPADTVPRMAVARGVVGPDGLDRQILVRVPFQDERAEDVLRKEAKQLPEGECGLIMVNVNSQPTAFEYWSTRIPERFNSGAHTRVAGVILFMYATQATDHGLAWLPHVKLISNPHAAVPLPSWIVEEIATTRAATQGRTERPA